MRLIYLALVLLTLSITTLGQNMPKPQLRLVGRMEMEENGKRFTGYELEVVNRAEFDDELFAPSPALPPCGLTENAPRTFVNIHNEKGSYVYGHCWMKSSADLASVRFSVPEGSVHPKRVFIYLVDRFEQRMIKSNAVRIE